MNAWDEVWARRTLNDGAPSVLASLIAADGFDTALGGISDADWRAGVGRLETELELKSGESIFEVGCGAGAYLYPFYERGFKVAGVDRSATLIEYAKGAMPEGDFAATDAADVDPSDRFDVVISSGTFMYFESLDYARNVLERMVKKATRGVAILDSPDAAFQDQALAKRIEAAGGEAAYRAKFDGLEHMYYERDWLASEMRRCGLQRVATCNQWVNGYGNAAHRFNTWGFTTA